MWFTNKQTWYKQTNEEKIKNYIDSNGLKTPYDFLMCFMYGARLENNEDFKKIVEAYKDEKTCVTIPLDKFIKTHYLELSKPLRTIFSCSSGLAIEYAEMKEKRTVIKGPTTFVKFEFNVIFFCP